MREDLISRRKVLLLAGLATGLAVPAASMLTASDAEAQQDTSTPPATPGVDTAPKKIRPKPKLSPRPLRRRRARNPRHSKIVTKR